LFVKAAAAIERGESRVVAADRRDALAERLGTEAADALFERLPESYVLAFEPEEMAFHAELLNAANAVRCIPAADAVTVTVITTDRPGLLATLAGALTVSGLDVLEANVFGTDDGRALDVFRTADPFGRVADGSERVVEIIEQALRGDLDLDARVEQRRRAYALGTSEPGPMHVDVDPDASESDSVVEVAADDDVGLLYRLASAFAQLNLDVRVANVATLGSRVVDVFYVRGPDGRKIDAAAAEHLRAVLTRSIAE